MKKQTLVIDIGNTSTSLGLYRSSRVSKVKRVDSEELTGSNVKRIIHDILPEGQVEGCSVCSVVPSLNEFVGESFDTYDRRACYMG